MKSISLGVVRYAMGRAAGLLGGIGGVETPTRSVEPWLPPRSCSKSILQPNDILQNSQGQNRR